MKKNFTILLFTFFYSFANAQQIGLYSHYFYKPMIYNPAFTGNGDATNAMLASHSQWSDFKGAPQLTVFSLDGNLLDKKAGIGVVLTNDRKGISNQTEGKLYYAYHLKINEDAHLSFGLAAGLTDQTFDFSKAIVENSVDPTLFSDSQHKMAFTADAGLAFAWKGLEIGASVPQLISVKIGAGSASSDSNTIANYTAISHYMASVKYKFFISKEKGLSIIPQALVKFVPHIPFQYDGSISLDWADKFWIGATYKSNYAVAANAGFCLHKQLYLGYSYDIIIGNIGKYSGISQEIMVNFKFGKDSKSTVPILSVAQEDKQDPAAELKNEEYEEKMNKLQKQLKKNDEKLKELNNKLDEQAKKQANNSPQPSSKPGVADSDGIYVTNINDFKNDKNLKAEKGFYVIVGIFFYRDYATDEVKSFVKKGFKNSNWLYSETLKNNYVFVQKLDTKEEAFEKVKEANAAGGSNVWILKLID